MHEIELHANHKVSQVLVAESLKGYGVEESLADEFFENAIEAAKEHYQTKEIDTSEAMLKTAFRQSGTASLVEYSIAGLKPKLERFVWEAVTPRQERR